MRRALLHSGLAALLVLAPALCCCNVRWLTGHAGASEHAVACPSCPEPAPAPPPCCPTRKPVEKSYCEAGESASPQAAQPDNAPAPQQPEPPAHCKCSGERPDATPPEAAPAIADPQATGELLPLAVLGVAGVAPEHLGLLGGLNPPERAGVDTRSATLFDRHVLRC